MQKATITTAGNMSDDTYQKLCDGILKKYGGEIEFYKQIDKTILGGFILKINGFIYDYSIKTQLNELNSFIHN